MFLKELPVTQDRRTDDSRAKDAYSIAAARHKT